MTETALVPTTDDLPLPVFSGAQMTAAFRGYRDLQASLDQDMPDQIMSMPDGRRFRKKGYWRAIAVAFNLTVEPITERRDVDGAFEDGRENFGWYVSYQAIAPNGRRSCGDGACFAVEKAKRGEAHKFRPLQATEHNVRSHAHTRAFNRAVSNLVGFGEVSAEEVEREDGEPGPPVELPPAAPDAPQLALPKCGICRAEGVYEPHGQYGPYYSCPKWKDHPKGSKKWFQDAKKWAADPRSKLTATPADALKKHEPPPAEDKLVPPLFMREEVPPPRDEPPF